ncbi:MAG: radical SAM protein [Methylovirgula sp.]|jgi:pyruvate-formate lyase-activating enzyme
MVARLYLYFGRQQNAPWLVATSHLIERTIMVKRRQKRCETNFTQSCLTNESLESYLKTHFCPNPFTTLETTHQGLAYVCCSIWLPTPIGRLDSDPEDLWKGATAQKLRQSILDGSFRYCSRVHCPAIANRTLPARDSKEAQEVIKAFETETPPPKRIILSHDKSCNLSCPSCRAMMVVADKKRQEKLDSLIERVIVPLLRGAESTTITGSGDAFGSNHFRNLIRRITNVDAKATDEFPHLKINLQTNGQLWDQRAWKELGLSGRVHYAQISIDAAQPETYAFVRRGGTFERLLRNLEFIRELRRSDEIKVLEFSMVVQSRNFREIPEFIALGEEYAADTVSFQMIRKRDIFSGDEHKDAFIGSPDHPDYEEFVALLRRKDLFLPRPGGPAIQMGNVLDYVRRATPDRLAAGEHVRSAAE